MKAILIFVLLNFPCSFLIAEEKELNIYPSTLTSAVDRVIGSLSDEDKFKFRATDKLDLISFHHGFGTGIRNSLGLWRGNNDLIIESCGKPCHPGDASGVIIYAVWSKLNGIPFNRKSYEKYQEDLFDKIMGKTKPENSDKKMRETLKGSGF